MYSKALKNIPFEQAIPYSKDDLLLVMTKEVALRLTSIIDENGAEFSISHTMETEPIFKCKDYNARCEEFAEIMTARLERYFDTKKSDYIFFDLEEQKILEKIFNISNLNCSVIIYMQKDGEFKEIDLDDLDFTQSRKCLPILNKLKARSVLKPDEYYKMRQATKKKSEEQKKKFEQMAKKHQNEVMGKYFKRYPKLSSFKTQTEVKKYYRKLAKKYHPDAGGDNDIFIIINEDFDIILNSKWFNKLPAE